MNDSGAAGAGRPLGGAARAPGKTRPHSARVWNHWLDGKDGYIVDQWAGKLVEREMPDIRAAVRQCLGFAGRAVRHLAEAGIGQFLDIGTGLPPADPIHQIVHEVNPEAVVAYVDNDPLVLTHARALLAHSTLDTVRVVDADLDEPEKLLARARDVLDFHRPIGLLMMGVLGHAGTDLGGPGEPCGPGGRDAAYSRARCIVRYLVDALPSGSCLAAYDITGDDPGAARAEAVYAKSGAAPYLLRTPEQVAGFFDGLEPVEPGVVRPGRWRPPGPPAPDVPARCGVARKP